MQISVVIPLLDEASTLRELHRRLGRVLQSLAPGSYEIVFVDDGSGDDSAAVLEELAREDPERVVVVEFRRNAGKAAALAAGFAEARGELVATLDADLQDVPEELPRMLARLERGADLVTGLKRKRRDPWFRVAASRVFNWMVSWITGCRVHDVNSGMKIMRAEIVRALPLHGQLHRYLPVMAQARGYSTAEIDVRHEPRRFGRSRYGAYRYLAGLMDLFTVMMLTRFEKRPIHFFGIVGFALAIAGSAILAYLSVGWFFGRWIADRPLFPLSILMMILGLQSLFFGVLAELVVLGERHRDAGYTIRRVLRRGESVEPARGARAA